MNLNLLLDSYQKTVTNYGQEFNDTGLIFARVRTRKGEEMRIYDSPRALALMAKMQIAPEDPPRVKAECLRLLVTLKLDPAKMQLISGFIDTYLSLNESEEQAFRDEIGTTESEEREEVMQIVTSWMRTGIQQGQASMVIPHHQ